ncbi:MAG: peptidoglycan DD-metalloendopeptidase family protein [Vibrio sp.]
MRALIRQLPIFHKTMIGMISVSMVILAFSLPDMEELTSDKIRFKIGEFYPVDIAEDALQTETPSITPMLTWQTHTVKPGESTALLFSRAGLSANLLYQLINTSEEIKAQLSKLRPGDKLMFGFNENKDLTQLVRPISEIESFKITKENDTFLAQVEKKEVNKHLNHANATITSNFWNAATASGLNPNQITSLATIFSWDVDFALDIRKGDSFEVLYEEKFVEGKNVGSGDIIAAVFTNQGRTYKAVRNPSDGNYYDENGRAMKKAFLRSPLDFRRVTSNFNPRRLHPVTGQVRPHRGTDYAAPVGTPIWAAGDGVVEKAGYNQFNGNYVFVRHNGTYLTKYLHLQKRSVKTGQRVKQGQTIGTLGGTGRVTGPHLHYEFLVNGVHKNPTTVDLPQSQSLTGDQKKQFVKVANQQLSKLQQYKVRFIARNANNNG